LEHYQAQPALTRDFANEVRHRLDSAVGAVDVLWAYRRLTPKHADEIQHFKSIRYIMARFAVLELCTIIDGSGLLALKLNRPKNSPPTVHRARLNRFFEKFAAADLDSMEQRLNKLLRRHNNPSPPPRAAYDPTPKSL
jgi:hypothetical protein